MQNILEYARLKEIKERDCYEKENHFSCIVVFALVVSGVFVLTKCLKTNSNHEQVNVVEEKDEEFNLQEEEQSKERNKLTETE